MSAVHEFALDLRRFRRYAVSGARAVKPAPAGICGRDGCTHITPPPEHHRGEVVSWRADGSPGPRGGAMSSSKRRRLNLVALVARLRR